jgi:uncharacterized protein (TIGR04255 family)
LFSDRAKSKFAVITTSGVYFEAKSYVGFEAFLDDLRPVVDAFAECAQPEFYERIGLRYVDRVSGSDPEESYKYFDPRVLSFEKSDLGMSRMLINNHLQGTIGSDTLQVRFSQTENSPILPLDLLAPEFQDLATPHSGVHTFLDIDSYSATTTDFGWATVESDLWRLHEHSEKAFWEAITPLAEEEWGVKVVEEAAVDV